MKTSIVEPKQRKRIYRTKSVKVKVYSAKPNIQQRPREKQYGKLVWHVHNQKIVVCENLEWPALQKRKKNIMHIPQYQKGELKLHYQHTKLN